MPAKSPEAIARKREQRKNRKTPKPFIPFKLPGWRRLMPKMPNLTKSELRAMLESAWRNTAEL